MKAILEFTLPDDQSEYDRARMGSLAISTLLEIDQRLRAIVHYGEPTDAVRELCELVRVMIPEELLDA
jgi:hypothetical protein